MPWGEKRESMVNICIRKKRKRHVFRDTASKLKKKNDHVVKVGKYSLMTKLLPEKAKFPPIILKDPCDFPKLVWTLAIQTVNVSCKISNDLF